MDLERWGWVCHLGSLMTLGTGSSGLPHLSRECPVPPLMWLCCFCCPPLFVSVASTFYQLTGAHYGFPSKFSRRRTWLASSSTTASDTRRYQFSYQASSRVTSKSVDWLSLNQGPIPHLIIHGKESECRTWPAPLSLGRRPWAGKVPE